MSQYQAPIADMHFVMTELAGLGEIARLPGCEDATPDTVAAILEGTQLSPVPPIEVKLSLADRLRRLLVSED